MNVEASSRATNFQFDNSSTFYRKSFFTTASPSGTGVFFHKRPKCRNPIKIQHCMVQELHSSSEMQLLQKGTKTIQLLLTVFHEITLQRSNQLRVETSPHKEGGIVSKETDSL